MLLEATYATGEDAFRVEVRAPSEDRGLRLARDVAEAFAPFDVEGAAEEIHALEEQPA